jgi:three-Cys-motif partner protein
MLGFHGDAVLLSGPAGTMLKTRIVGDYYAFWWRITSGGPTLKYRRPTAIVDMNAATGEIYIEETNETVLGSAGHALSLKYDSGLPTEALSVVLVEENSDCYMRQKRVIRRRWANVPVDRAGDLIDRNDSGVYLLNFDLQRALDAIERIRLGNSIFFFDPLLHIEWDTIDRVARRRIWSFYRTGTEFIIFVFTSDWFTGRRYGAGRDLAALPTSGNEALWTRAQLDAIEAADALFGDRAWRGAVLVNGDQQVREEAFIEEYRKRLMKWFRWVLPLPFVPKQGRLYHLIFCSNYEDGIRVTRDLYSQYTRNPRYNPDNVSAYERFRKAHPKLVSGLTGNQRPLAWKVLWHVIRQCEGGVCDEWCTHIRDKGEPAEIAEAFSWLREKGFLEPLVGMPTAWPGVAERFQLSWEEVRKELNVGRPPKLRPITPDEIGT